MNMNKRERMGMILSGHAVANYFMHRLAKLEAETAQNASMIVTISQYSLGKIKQFYGIDKEKVRIVPNGVDTEKFKPLANRKANRAQFGLGKSHVCFL